MAELLNYLILYSLFAATLGFLFVMLFIGELRRWWMRVATIAAGVFALGLPFFVTFKTLGYPNPWPSEGKYEVFGWQVNELDQAYFVMVAKEGENAPQHYKVPFKLNTALKFQEARENVGRFRRISLVISSGSQPDLPNTVFTFEKAFSGE